MEFKNYFLVWFTTFLLTHPCCGTFDFSYGFSEKTKDADECFRMKVCHLHCGVSMFEGDGMSRPRVKTAVINRKKTAQISVRNAFSTRFHGFSDVSDTC